MSGVAELSPKYLSGTSQIALPSGYRQSEIGVIPEEWEVKTVFELAGFQKNLFDDGDWIEAEHITDKGIRLIQTGNIGVGRYIEKEAKKYIFNESFEKLKCKELREGDLLICRLAEPAGRACILPDIGDDKVITSVDVTIFRPSEEVANREFYNQYFSSSIWFKSVLEQVGGTTHKRISRGALGCICVCYPSLEEQTAIAKALSDVDALICELEKLIAKKQAIKTATMQQLLTGRTRLLQFALREDGTPKGTKPSELGEIPDDWEVVKLGDLAKFFKGSGLPKSALSENGKIKCIHYGQLFTIYGPKIEKVISRTKNVGTVTSQENDVLMPTSDVTPTGLATASCITETGVTLGGDILIIRTEKQKLNGVFFSYLVNVLRDQVMQLVTGSTVYHLYGSDMAKFEFTLPSEQEQTAIATILSDMDEEIQALEQRLTKTHQIKQGMMQELLIGKTRLPFDKE